MPWLKFSKNYGHVCHEAHTLELFLLSELLMVMKVMPTRAECLWSGL